MFWSFWKAEQERQAFRKVIREEVRDEVQQEVRQEAEVAVMERLESRATPAEIEVLRNLLNRINHHSNGEAK